MQALDDETRSSEIRYPAAAESLPDRGRGGGLVETMLSGANPGALRMLAYVPAGLRPKSPLVVVLHGCTQHAAENAEHAGWLQLADRLDFAVLAPEQKVGNNMNRCFNWFRTGDTRRDLGECASIAAMIDALMYSESLDPDRVFITGLSAGGAMAAAMLATYPEIFAGGAIIAGLPFGVAHNIQEAIQAMRGGGAKDGTSLAASVIDAAPSKSARPLRLSIWQGDKDGTVDPSNAHALIEQWTLARGSLHITSNEQVSERLTRTRWGDTADDGGVIELNMIHGLGHGTPMSTTRPGDVGAPARFLLECGISSTLDIAHFWGLGVSLARATAPVDMVRSRPRTAVAVQALGSIERHVPKEIQDVIARSLRAARIFK